MDKSSQMGTLLKQLAPGTCKLHYTKQRHETRACLTNDSHQWKWELTIFDQPLTSQRVTLTISVCASNLVEGYLQSQIFNLHLDTVTKITNLSFHLSKCQTISTTSLFTCSVYLFQTFDLIQFTVKL